MSTKRLVTMLLPLVAIEICSLSLSRHSAEFDDEQSVRITRIY